MKRSELKQIIREVIEEGTEWNKDEFRAREQQKAFAKVKTSKDALGSESVYGDMSPELEDEYNEIISGSKSNNDLNYAIKQFSEMLDSEDYSTISREDLIRIIGKLRWNYLNRNRRPNYSSPF